MLGLSGEKYSIRELGPQCRICGKSGAVPTVLRSDSREFMALFPFDFWIDATCEPCWGIVLGIGRAARRKATGNYDSASEDERNPK